MFSAPMLELHQTIPPLTARTPTGHVVRAWDYKPKKNVVVAFLHADCRRCEHFLLRCAESAVQLTEREAVALVIFSEVPPAALTGNLPREVVAAAEMGGHAQRDYLGKDAFGPAGQQRVGVFVADRYGELVAQWVGGDDALPGIGDALSWLSRIEEP